MTHLNQALTECAVLAGSDSFYSLSRSRETQCGDGNASELLSLHEALIWTVCEGSQGAGADRDPPLASRHLGLDPAPCRIRYSSDRRRLTYCRGNEERLVNCSFLGLWEEAAAEKEEELRPPAAVHITARCLCPMDPKHCSLVNAHVCRCQ